MQVDGVFLGLSRAREPRTSCPLARPRLPASLPCPFLGGAAVPLLLLPGMLHHPAAFPWRPHNRACAARPVRAAAAAAAAAPASSSSISTRSPVGRALGGQGARPFPRGPAPLAPARRLSILRPGSSPRSRWSGRARRGEGAAPGGGSKLVKRRGPLDSSEARPRRPREGLRGESRRAGAPRCPAPPAPSSQPAAAPCAPSERDRLRPQPARSPALRARRPHQAAPGSYEP